MSPLAATLVALVTVPAAIVAFSVVDMSRTSHDVPNVPPPRLWPALVKLEWLAMNLRARGARITSGFRGEQLNALVNGEPTSLHPAGRALDYVVDNPADAPAVHAFLLQLHRAGFLRKPPLHHDAGSGMHGHLEVA